WRIAPVVDLSGGTILGIELKYRQQLHGGNAKRLKIRDLLDQAGVSAARLLPDPRTRMARETAHVHLVNDGACGGLAQRLVSLPVVRVGIHDNAFHRYRGLGALPPRCP